MTRLNWKQLILTSLICLLPLLLGISYWHELPDHLATHISLAGEVTGATSKIQFLGSSLVLLAVQIVLILIVNLNKIGQLPQLHVMLWTIPFLGAGTQLLILAYNLGGLTDLRKFIIALIAVAWLIVGNYGTKQAPIFLKQQTVRSQKQRRQSAYAFIIIALALLISLFFPIEWSIGLLGLSTFSMFTWSIYCAVSLGRHR